METNLAGPSEQGALGLGAAGGCSSGVCHQVVPGVFSVHCPEELTFGSEFSCSAIWALKAQDKVTYENVILQREAGLKQQHVTMHSIPSLCHTK